MSVLEDYTKTKELFTIIYRTDDMSVSGLDLGRPPMLACCFSDYSLAT